MSYPVKINSRIMCHVIIVSLFVFGLMPGIQASEVQAEEKSRIQKWQEDIDYLASELAQRHKNLFFQISESEFMREIQKLKADLPDLHDEEIVWRISQIVASVGDAHSSIRFKTTIAFPFTLYWFKEGIYVINTVAEHQQILNCRLVRINDLPIDNVVETLKQGISHENQAQIKNSVPYYLAMAEYLFGAHVITEKDKAVFSFENKQGERLRVPLQAVSLKIQPQWVIANSDESELPLYRRNRDKNYSFTYLEGEKAMYVLYNRCVMTKGRLFKDFVNDIFVQVDSQPVNRIVIDVRNNGGGNSMIFYPLLRELKARDELNQKGKLYVILGRRTFSSAVLNAVQMKNQTNALFFGEPTGGKPNHYGEVKRFLLKNSQLQVSYSTKYFTHSKEDNDSIYPDVLIEISIQDYLDKRDPVLEKILHWGK